jgi:hypothetical protein
LTTLPLLLVAAGGLVVGLAVPAAARETGHLINGNSIKVHSIAGDRLKANTLTGAQIKESTLGAVPRATVAVTASKLPPLVWHTITTFENGWSDYNFESHPAAWAVDAQGIVHLRGVVFGGALNDPAFALPLAVAPDKQQIWLECTSAEDEVGVILISDGQLTPASGENAFMSLDGLTYSPN